ncbi:glycosyltransferase family 4 protein [Parasediminibacterium paludis]|uniref:Glycosyltransferase family 4 protein n=1 Tax=Parasediminibacterium paludis TaxID=908966 RepID=A0ABV8Q0C8_9BACT
MQKKIIVFDSHPVQYRVPVWQQLHSLKVVDLTVVYASDCSIQGHADEGFGITFSWDEPMLSGYDAIILNCVRGKPLMGWASLTGEGIAKILDEQKPDIIFLTGFNYRYDWVAYWEAYKRKITIWVRCETQDNATVRPKWKALLRYLFYYFLYKRIDKFFYIGELNKAHYLKHGVSNSQLIAARYCTVDRFVEMSFDEKHTTRQKARAENDIDEDRIVIGFSGKLIPKKNPDIIFEAIKFLPNVLQAKIVIYFLGSGEMEVSLKECAKTVKATYGCDTKFIGFVNQTQLAKHYLAMDMMILPSRRMGETWGLVVNEALQAGCCVIVSDAVGSSADFKGLERFRIFKEGNAEELAIYIKELAEYDRSYNWATSSLKNYSVENVAMSIAI